MKENRQGCLSRSIKRFLSTFLKCSKIQQLVEKTFSTSCGGYQSGIRRRREISRKSGSDPPPPCRCRRCRRYLSAPWPRWGRERQAGWGPGGCSSPSFPENRRLPQSSPVVQTDLPQYPSLPVSAHYPCRYQVRRVPYTGTPFR